MQVRPVMSSVDPGGQVHRKLPNVFKQLPFLHGVILHSSTSITKDKTKLFTYMQPMLRRIKWFLSKMKFVPNGSKILNSILRANKYELLWPNVKPRWLDIGQFLFLRVYGPRRSRGLLYGFRGNYSCGIQRVIPSSILPARVANHIARIDSSRPLAEPAM